MNATLKLFLFLRFLFSKNAYINGLHFTPEKRAINYHLFSNKNEYDNNGYYSSYTEAVRMNEDDDAGK